MDLSYSSLVSMSSARHPTYDVFGRDWVKWRLTMKGGQSFLDKYLVQYSSRENVDDFKARKAMSYCASYAKSSIREIVNAVFQRMRDISRVGGHESYITAVDGRNGGVNREGMSMNMFMGRKILPELLSMGKVGVYVDMPNTQENATLAETYRNRPYLYYYPVEDILNWNYTNQELRSVVLRDTVYTYNEIGMPIGLDTRYRVMWQSENSKVYVHTFTTKQDEKTKQINIENLQQYELALPRIPFHIVDIGESLLEDIADHQIALTNMESSDIAFAVAANFPIYTEQTNPNITPTNTKSTDKSGADGKLETGPLRGRRYPKDTQRPDFIHPSPEPLQVAMAKEDQIKAEIRHLVHLAVSKLAPQRESADSKALDNEGLEAGLAFIGLTLENAENFISEIWSAYTGYSTPATVKYPSQYSILSDSERRQNAKSLLEMRDDIPSILGRKEITKLAVRTLFDSRVPPDIMDDIYDEVTNSPFVSGRVDEIERDVKEGLVSKATASQARGYDKKEAALAEEEFMIRLKFINDTQTKGGDGGRSLPDGSTDTMKNPAARGVRDLSPAPDANAATEKQ